MPTGISTTRTIKSWAQANRLTLHRTSPCGTYSGVIDRGVNYFVLALEQLGAQPEYSCEGHPNSFYVLFSAPQSVAEAIRARGFFAVELEGEDRWSIRISRNVTEDDRRQILKHAARVWTTYFGPIHYSQERKHAQFSELVFG